jgi:hypothetical protein
MSPAPAVADLDIRARIRLTGAILVLGLLCAAAIMVSGMAMPLLSVDSPGYIAWSPERTPGYPLFLSLIAAFSPGYSALPEAQYVLFIAATAAFCDALAGLLRSLPAGFATAIAVLGNLYLMRYPTTIMADSLYLGLVLVHAACVLHSLRSPSLAWPVLAGVALGCAILVRPAGYALLLALPWLPFVWRERRWLRAIVLAGGVAAMIVAACIGNYAYRGFFATQAFGGVNLILKIATMAPTQIAGFDPAATARSYDELRPLRDSEQAEKSWERRTLIPILTYNHGQPVFEPLNAAIESDPGKWKTNSPYWREIAQNDLGGEFARRVIAANPAEYARRVIRQLYGLWFMPQLSDPSTANAVSDILVRVGKLDRARDVDPDLKVVPLWAYATKFIVFAGLLIASLSVIVWALFRRDMALAGLAYLSIATHCYFLLVAGVEVALPRYSLMAWPFQCAIAFGVALPLLRRSGWTAPDKERL